MGLFGKQEEKKPSAVGSEPTTSASTQSKAAAPSASVTVIGPQAVVKGELQSSENVTIDGRVEGKVKCQALLTIGPTGDVRAEIDAKSVTVRGKVEGNCTASHRVEITETGKVFGNVRAPLIVVAEGAVFRGASEMSSKEEPKAAAKPQPPPRAETPAASPPPPVKV